jgi:hypothetical protein
MTFSYVRCRCGDVEAQLTGSPISQYVCHCDDCQSVHGKAYPVALYSSTAVLLKRGNTVVVTLKTSPRTKCARCGTYFFAEVPGQPFLGVNGDLLSNGLFRPEFHMQCQYAPAPVKDDLPHYKGAPKRFRGSGELMSWEP